LRLTKSTFLRKSTCLPLKSLS